jgi:hypothetical protein
MVTGAHPTFSWYDKNTAFQVHIYWCMFGYSLTLRSSGATLLKCLTGLQALPLGPGLAKCFPEDKGMKPASLSGKSPSSHAPAQFCVRDIEGAFSVPKNRLIRRVRNTNPLCPVYRLPNADYREVLPPLPKYLRNTLDVNDIMGTKVSLPLQFTGHRNVDLFVLGWNILNHVQITV